MLLSKEFLNWLFQAVGPGLLRALRLQLKATDRRGAPDPQQLRRSPGHSAQSPQDPAPARRQQALVPAGPSFLREHAKFISCGAVNLTLAFLEFT